MDCPCQNPDLNITERVWDYLDCEKLMQLTTKTELVRCEKNNSHESKSHGRNESYNKGKAWHLIYWNKMFYSSPSLKLATCEITCQRTNFPVSSLSVTLLTIFPGFFLFSPDPGNQHSPALYDLTENKKAEQKCGLARWPCELDWNVEVLEDPPFPTMYNYAQWYSSTGLIYDSSLRNVSYTLDILLKGLKCDRTSVV